MTKKNPSNERAKRRYFEFLRQADGKSEQTIRQVEKAIARFEVSTGYADLKSFDQKQAIAFKGALKAQELAPSTVLSTLGSVKRFLGWLSQQPGFKLKVRLSDVEYLNLPEKDIRAASAPTDKKYPTLQMVERVVAAMPEGTPIEKRDRALIAFTAITGIRDGALVSLRVKHFDAERRLVIQNPVEVATKFSKRIDTFLFPLSDELEKITLDWLHYIKNTLLFAQDDPLFPKTRMGQDENNCFRAIGLGREHWANAAPIRDVFKRSFEAIGLPNFTPHRMRDMIVHEMYERNLSVAQFKAWSQNLGHESAMTTLTSYGKLSLQEQGELVRQPGDRTRPQAPSIDQIEQLLKKYQ